MTKCSAPEEHEDDDEKEKEEEEEVDCIRRSLSMQCGNNTKIATTNGIDSLHLGREFRVFVVKQVVQVYGWMDGGVHTLHTYTHRGIERMLNKR